MSAVYVHFISCLPYTGSLDSSSFLLFLRFVFFVTVGYIFLPPRLVIEPMYESSVFIPNKLCVIVLATKLAISVGKFD